MTKQADGYIHDERREYLAHVLSRTKRKDYENYVVNAVWQRLADPYLQPETQRYVRRNNGYALIDLYFPAVNVGVECDEAYHLGDWQRKSDRAREEEIAARLNSVDGAGDYLACHVRAFGTFEQMEHDIDQAVKAINRRKREMRPKPWMPGVPPWETAIEQGRIRVGDGLAFHSIADVCRCFGRNPKRMQRCYFSLQHERYYLWCPKLGIEMPDGTVASAAFGITNTLSYDGKTLYQTTDKYKAGPADVILRVTFARGKDELGRTAYRFIGVFRHDGPKEDDPWTGVDVRVADEIDLSPWNLRRACRGGQKKTRRIGLSQVSTEAFHRHPKEFYQAIPSQGLQCCQLAYSMLFYVHGSIEYAAINLCEYVITASTMYILVQG